MWKLASILLSFVVTASAATITGDQLNSSQLFPRSIQTTSDQGGGLLGRVNVGKDLLGNPIEWTMSKANLVAEVFTSEPSLPIHSSKESSVGRSQKSLFSFFGTPKNESGGAHVKRSNNEKGPPPGGLIPSETNYNGHAVIPLNVGRIGSNNNANAFRFPNNGGGFATPFRPIKFPRQSGFPSQTGSPDSGYPQNVRPPRGPLPPQQVYGAPNKMTNRPINGLRPPPAPNAPLYPPPQVNQRPSQITPSSANQQQIPLPLPLTNLKPQQTPIPQSQYQQQGQYTVPQNNSQFTPSQQYLPQPKPEQNQQQPPPQLPPPPSAQIRDNYRNQAQYPGPLPQASPENKPPVMPTTSNYATPAPRPSSTAQQPDSFTNYENEAIPQQFPNQQQTPRNPQPSHQSPPSNLNVNDLTITEPLSQVLADANAKAGEATDKTIRFVIHKPEDEDIVKNAILEDAQNRYEDVRFVQGPTLKVQRKETVYLPPKRKTVVYILLKEPQIDTNVEVMTPQEDDPAPEVYITYQKSDGAVKTKHYSPKPMRQEDMKKYLDIEEDSAYGSPEESRIHPRFSKSTSVSLSTSSKTSRTTASTSSSLEPTEVIYNNTSRNSNTTSLLANHKLSGNDTKLSDTQPMPLLKTSPLLYSTFTSSSSSDNPSDSKNKNNTVISRDVLQRYRNKTGRSTSLSSSRRPVFIPPAPRRVLRNPAPVQCPTVT